MTDCVIYGCGGHARGIRDVADGTGRLNVLGFLDDDEARWGSQVDGLPVLGGIRALTGPLARRVAACVVGIGDNRARARVFALLRERVLDLPPVVAASAVVSPWARVAAGVVVMARAVVNTGARIGENACINTAAVVEHDVVAAPHSHVCPGATITGGARLGAFAFVGAGAVVCPGVRIGAGACVGAGAVVTRDVGDGVTVVGVPARPLAGAGSAGGTANDGGGHD